MNLINFDGFKIIYDVNIKASFTTKLRIRNSSYFSCCTAALIERPKLLLKWNKSYSLML